MVLIVLFIGYYLLMDKAVLLSCFNKSIFLNKFFSGEQDRQQVVGL